MCAHKGWTLEGRQFWGLGSRDAAGGRCLDCLGKNLGVFRSQVLEALVLLLSRVDSRGRALLGTLIEMVLEGSQLGLSCVGTIAMAIIIVETCSQEYNMYSRVIRC